MKESERNPITIKRDKARDLAATMAVSATTASIAERRTPPKTAPFEQRLSTSMTSKNLTRNQNNNYRNKTTLIGRTKKKKYSKRKREKETQDLEIRGLSQGFGDGYNWHHRLGPVVLERVWTWIYYDGRVSCIIVTDKILTVNLEKDVK